MKANVPDKAFILAAGFGTRMLPLSREIPKPLLPLWGKPVLLCALEMVRDWGVRDVMVNTHHGAGEIVEFLRRNPVRGLRVNISFEPAILGTGGGLKRVEWFFDGRPFWLLNADVVARLNPQPLIDRFASKKPLAVLWMHPDRGPRTVEMKNGLIVNFESRAPRSEGTCTFTGLHLVSPRILDFLPDEGFAGIIPAYQRAQKKGERICGVTLKTGYWADIGTPRQYLDAHAETRPATRDVNIVSVAPDAVIGRGARLRNIVVLDRAVVAPGARIENAVIGPDTQIGGYLSNIVMRADRGLDLAEAGAVRKIGWPLDKTVLQTLGARGSARTFTRLRNGHRSVILIQYSLDRKENGLYADHARFLDKIGIQVPRILVDSPADRLLLIEDYGDESLQELVAHKKTGVIRQFYRKVLDAVLVFHEKGTRTALRKKIELMPAFSPALYRWEREYFARELLEQRLGLAPKLIDGLLRELAGIGTRLGRAPRTLIHRDLQSSNLYLRHGRAAFIDFQGMRIGAAAYDLASLLCDPYVELPEDLQTGLLDYYADRSSQGETVRRLFWPAAVQRLAQALGAFSRLSAIAGAEQFGRHFLPALRMMRRALRHLDGFPLLTAFVNRQLDNRKEFLKLH